MQSVDLNSYYPVLNFFIYRLLYLITLTSAKSLLKFYILCFIESTTSIQKTKRSKYSMNNFQLKLFSYTLEYQTNNIFQFQRFQTQYVLGPLVQNSSKDNHVNWRHTEGLLYVIQKCLLSWNGVFLTPSNQATVNSFGLLTMVVFRLQSLSHAGVLNW